MLDLNKKYWVQFGRLAVRCSIESANVVFNISGKAFGKDGGFPHLGPKLEDLSISEEAKSFYLQQLKEGYPCPTAFPNNPESIKYLKEFEELGYVVFYDVDEPIGHSLGEDELEEDKDPEVTLEEEREKAWNSIANSHERAGFPRPEMQEYPKKEHGKDWYVIIEDKDEDE